MKECNGPYTKTTPELFQDYSFELSDFQKWAIYAITQNNDCLVCAPTGSGKTLPAEFAIKWAHKHNKKVIYTTPIKALSNEKFYSFQKKYPDISFGLLTGDNKFNPEADVLIMTTEILLNTLKQMKSIDTGLIEEKNTDLYFKMDVNNELGFVVFDEIHYINDKDRGKVWEQSIMFLPKHVAYIGLSATIKKPETLCKWSESEYGPNRKEMYLCVSNHRVVPLQHYGYLTLPDSNFDKMKVEDRDKFQMLANKPINLKNKNEPFDENMYHKISKAFKYLSNNKIYVKHNFVYNNILKYLYRQNLLPALTFIFSRKQCYVWAKSVSISLFEEGSKIPSIIKKKATQILISKLDNWKEYTELKEFTEIVRLLEKGIAVHHSGVTPVFREMIELLYGEGYIKLLIATETFAVGINMPTRSVIFTSLQKFDGHKFRFLMAHEYSQMAGRAGRRGIDTKGHIFHLLNIFDSKNAIPSASVYRNILSGVPQTIISKFDIDFQLILSQLFVGNNNFSEFVNTSMLRNEMLKEQKVIDEKIIKLKDRVSIIETNQFLYRVPKNLLEEYHNLLTKYEFTTKKKVKKKMHVQINNMEMETKNLKDDYQKYLKNMEVYNELEKIEKKKENIESYVDAEVNLLFSILQDNEFIDENKELTMKGKIAANINEIHSLALADILIENGFDHLTPEELVSVLSIFTSIRLSDEDKYISVEHINTNDTIKQTIKKIKNKLDKYYDVETRHQTSFTQQYDIHYDMAEFLYKWCFATNDVECKLIYQEAKKYNIYIGEFVKAILKINNICVELEKICLIQENIKLLNMISKVKEVTLKSIATNQSLYI